MHAYIHTYIHTYLEHRPSAGCLAKVLGLASGSSGYARRALQLRCAELVGAPMVVAKSECTSIILLQCSFPILKSFHAWPSKLVTGSGSWKLRFAFARRAVARKVPTRMRIKRLRQTARVRKSTRKKICKLQFEPSCSGASQVPLAVLCIQGGVVIKLCLLRSRRKRGPSF